MSDVLTKTQRSYNMSQIKCKDTGPEMKFRRYLFEKGLRGYRTSIKIIGKPDIVFTKYNIVIFIDGCFWHKCPLCFKEPDDNKNFWLKKIDENVNRDQRVTEELKDNGWTVLRFWEHDIIKNIEECYKTILSEISKGGRDCATS